MRSNRLITIILLLLFTFTVSQVAAQGEATAEPEATEMATDAEATEEVVDDASGDISTYVVQRGDNLFRIALQFGLTTAQLAEANNITNPALIFVGQELTIPSGATVVTPAPEVTAEPTSEPEATEEAVATEAPTPEVTAEPDDTTEETAISSYVVQAGDTLFRIAVRNNTTVARLLSLNPSIVNPNLIFVGQRLNLPEGAADGEDESADNDSATSTEALDVAMVTGVEIFLDGDALANASLATQLGVDWVKLTVDWAVVEPEEGTFEFAALDSAIDAFDSNFSIMINLTGAPDWARPSATDLAKEQPTYGPPDDLDTFGTFAGAVADRYAGRVDAYEIWFQPNNRLSWMRSIVELRSDGFPDAGLSDVRYVDLLEVAYSAINAVDSDALVITAGLAPTGNDDGYNSIDNFVFFEALLEQGAANFSDGFGVHVDGYGNAPDATCCGTADADPEFDESYHFFFADSLDNYREILDRNGGSDLPLWVTRFGWGTTEGASGNGSDAPFVTLNTAQQQADYVVGALAAGDARGDVGAMMLYNLNGCAVNNTSACYYSLVDADGNARTAFNAVASDE
ncbi:MAG: LysM peptidoglycan-binding domain-containing protein [Phototrophicaceae bacterium]